MDKLHHGGFPGSLTKNSYSVITDVYSELSQTSKMKHFAKITNCFKSLFTFAKSSILDVLLGPDICIPDFSCLTVNIVLFANNDDISRSCSEKFRKTYRKTLVLESRF